MIFNLYFFCCLGLGYATLNRFDPLEIGALNDFVYYENVVRLGFYADGWIKLEDGTFHPDDLTRNRILVPFLAHLIYTQLPELGSWNLVNFSMLLVTSLFTASTALIIYKMSAEIFFSRTIALTASLLFLLNYFVANSYLVGSVDSGYGFFLVLVTYILYKDKWRFLPTLAIMGTLTKEVFLPIGSSLIFGWLLYDWFRNKTIRLTRIIQFLLFLMLSAATIFTLYYVQTSAVIAPWTLIEPLVFTGLPVANVSSLDFQSAFFSFSRFFLVIGPLLFLASYSLLLAPRSVLAPTICAWVTSLCLSILIGFHAEDYSRFMFSSGAFLLCSCAALTLNNRLTVMTEHENESTRGTHRRNSRMRS